MPLTLLGIGEKGTITQLTGDLALRMHLTELGFVLGKGIEIIQETFGNNLIVKLENSRLAVDRRMAFHIHIDMYRKDDHV